MPWSFSLLIILFLKTASTGQFPLLSPTTSAPSGQATPSLPAQTPTPSPKQMTVFSVYVGEGEGESQQQELTVSCRLDRALSNLQARVLVVGMIRDDVTGSGGRVLIPAGSKVVGQGFCDAERARFLGRGRWTCFTGDHQISAEGVLLDRSRIEGLEGAENTDAVEATRVKEAIYRDGIFLYVPAGTEFLLRLRGNVSVQELGSAADH